MVLLGVVGRWSRLEEKPAKRSLSHWGLPREYWSRRAPPSLVQQGVDVDAVKSGNGSGKVRSRRRNSGLPGMRISTFTRSDRVFRAPKSCWVSAAAEQDLGYRLTALHPERTFRFKWAVAPIGFPKSQCQKAPAHTFAFAILELLAEPAG